MKKGSWPDILMANIAKKEKRQEARKKAEGYWKSIGEVLDKLD